LPKAAPRHLCSTEATMPNPSHDWRPDPKSSPTNIALGRCVFCQGKQGFTINRVRDLVVCASCGVPPERQPEVRAKRIGGSGA
jgi:hypothetical protein